MKSGLRRHFRFYTVFAIATIAFSLVAPGQASAFDNTLPDPADTEGSASIMLVNTRNTYVQRSDSQLAVWFPNNSGWFTIHNGHFCNDNPSDYMETGSWGTYGSGANITRYRATSSGAVIDGVADAKNFIGEKYNSGDARCNNTYTFNVSSINAQQNGYYVVDLDVDFVAPSWGGVNYFRITASSGARIGLRGTGAGGGSGHTTTQEQVNTTPTFVNYIAPFGTPCNVTTGEWATVSLFDIDNAGGSGAQPNGTNVRVRVKDYKVLSDPNDDVYVDWEGSPGTYWTPNGDNTTSTRRFFARPGHKYRLEILDVYWNNTIQYSLPYSQIYRLPCNWSLTSSARIDGVVGPVNSRRGVAHTFSFAVNRSGGPTADIRIVERWISGNSGNVYDNASYDFGPDFSDNYGFTVPANAARGTDYCMDVWYSEIAWNNAGNGNSNNVCINVVEAVVSAGITQTPDETSYVEVGGTVASDATIVNSGDATANLQYHHQMWYEVGGITGPADRAYDAGTDAGLQQAGWTNINVAPGPAAVVHTFSQAVTAPPANTTHVCSRMRIASRAGDTSIINTSDVVKCTPIGKSPSFVVRAGDVRTGGSYGSGTCSVTKPAAIAADNTRLSDYFGVITHNYVGVDSVNPHHAYVRDAAISLGDLENLVTNKAAVGGGADTTLHFARLWGAVQPANTVYGGGRFYGEFSSMPNPTINTHCLSPLFDATRYPATASPVVTVGAGVTTQSLPSPAATGATAVTYNICGSTADRLLVLNGPGGGDLVLQPEQQYIVRVTQTGAGCNANPVHVRINKNVIFTGTTTTAQKLPQFVFLVGDDASSRVHIQVDNAVTRLDGIYANRGSARFVTCAQRASDPVNRATSRNIVTPDCSNQLTINGAVVLGGRLEPYRAFGHDAVANTNPAEVFNLRPDVILGDFARDRTGSQLEIVNRRELAPRF